MRNNNEQPQPEQIHIGWASVDITPAQPVFLAGQFHMRVSEGIADPITVTALALSSGKNAGTSGSVVLVSCDLVAIPDGLRDSVRALVAAALPDLDPGCVVINGTHTHTAPEVRTPTDYKRFGGGISSMGMCVDLPAMEPDDYIAFAAGRIADAVTTAWSSRAPGAIGYGLGHAVVGRNRRATFAGGISRMYGNTNDPDFSHIEGYEDHSVNLLATWDAGGTLTGLVVNVACPSQVSENLFEVSADYWHETRMELHRQFGDGLFVLPQCSAAGDQSPRAPWAKAAETRMLEMAGRTLRQEIAVRIANAVNTTLPLVEKERQTHPVLAHRIETVALQRRRLSESDVAEAMEEANGLRAEYEKHRQELDTHPERKNEPRWYVDITRCYRRMMWCEGVALRFEIEKTSPTVQTEVHVLRLGDMAMATNPFEYYLDFGIRIKARSPAVQTFLVQLAGAGTYVPTERAVAGKSYGAVPASTPVGPEGGRALVEWTVAALQNLWKPGAATDIDEQVRKAIAGMQKGHPRVLVTPERAAAVRAATDSPAGRLADAIVEEAEQVLSEPPTRYEKEGRRLLHVSREALRRLTRLGVAWLRSGDTRFVRRAELEIQAVCAFPDWNPSHYLDTAEMALAVAFAYDWLYDALSPDARAVAREGLVRHAFGTAFPPDDAGWPVAHNNWGQVCHAGLAAAALALADEEPETARRIVCRAVRNMPLAGACYAPDGDYPEGPIYWNYGTSFHVVLLEVLRSALHDDFGLSAMPGFMASAASVMHLTGPTGNLYGFADGRSPQRYFTTLLWFDAEGGLTLPPDAPERQAAVQGMATKDRLDPLAVFWADRRTGTRTEGSLPLDHFGRGSQPVLTMRSSWNDRQAWYVGVKGGSPQGPHGHMDGGSFILEAHGERWVLDLGAENYHRIESRGMTLWDSSQDSDRWRIFRLSTTAHSVLRIDDAQQHAAGHAEPLACVVDTPDPTSRWDVTSLYPAAKRVERRFAFPGRAALCVTDTVEGAPAGSRVIWSFPTRAEVELYADAPGTATLRQNGRELRISASGDGIGAWQVNAVDALLQPYDSPLPDVRLVFLTAVVPASGSVEIAVRFA